MLVHLLSALLFIHLLFTVESEDTEDKKKLEDVSKNGKEKWGYVHVRKDAHMFYWLYYSSHPDGYKSRPWIIWLQGGPGSSSCGDGNFGGIGPLKPDLTPRNTTWVKQASVLFVDSPVGAGFSYGDDFFKSYNTNHSGIIDDLVEFLKEFLKRTPNFKTYPLYIFGHSYGGKVAAHLAQRLYDAIQSKRIKANLVGVAMVDAWISPLDSVRHYAELAEQMAVVDENGKSRIQKQVDKVKVAIEKESWTEAYKYFLKSHDQFYKCTQNLNPHDMAKYFRGEKQKEDIELFTTMENLKKTKLKKVANENEIWAVMETVVLKRLEHEIMKPSISVVDDLLQNTDLQVIVYQEQLDLVHNYNGAVDWIRQLSWSNISNYNSTRRRPLINPVNKQTVGYVKAYDRFKFYSLLGAGHAYRYKDDASYRVLDRILSDFDRPTNDSYTE